MIWTGNFSVAKAVSTRAFLNLNWKPPSMLTGVQATKTPSSIPTSSASSEVPDSRPTATNSTSPSLNGQKSPQNEVSAAAKARIGFAICIVVVLVIIGVALIFFEHGKRIAARTRQLKTPKPPLERMEEGSMGLELAETRFSMQKGVEVEITDETFTEPATPLLYKKKHDLKVAVELEGGLMKHGVKKKAEAVIDNDEGKTKRIASMRGMYELG